MRVTLISVLAASLIACVGCSSNKPQTGEVDIHISGTGYSPSNVTVATGAYVKWINDDSQPHSATSPGAFDSGTIAPGGGFWIWVAAVPGTHAYYSLLQPDMKGVITVQASGPTTYP